MKKQISFIVATILITLFIFNNSLKTADVSGSESAFFSDLLSSLLIKLNLSEYGYLSTVLVRKAAHIFEFFVHAVMLAGCFTLKYRKRIVYILFFGLLTACVDEYIQYFIDGRGSMVQDIFVDFAGTILGMAAGRLIYTLKNKQHQNHSHNLKS